MQEVEVGDFIRRIGGELGATVYPPEQRVRAIVGTKLKSEIVQWSAIIKKAGVYAD